MRAPTRRAAVRWLHILASVPILGYIYGPLGESPMATLAIRAVIVPAVVLSGLWLWKGHLVWRAFRPGPARARTEGGMR